MEVFNSFHEFPQRFLDKSYSLGMVPTMGALHDGHLSLVEKAISENDKVLITIFINPTQFDDDKDLINYPRELQKDLEKISHFGENIWAYTPNASEIYGEHLESKHYDLNSLENVMEGKSRAGHFQGVATVVEYFLKTFSPTRAYFGEKDYQQLQIITHLNELLGLSTEIVGCPIVRTSDGLAMSSRNALLTVEERKIAPQIYQGLQLAKKLAKDYIYKSILDEVHAFFHKHSELKLEYFTAADPSTLVEFEPDEKITRGRGFIAVRLGKIRLIDNINMS